MADACKRYSVKASREAGKNVFSVPLVGGGLCLVGRACQMLVAKRVASAHFR